KALAAGADLVGMAYRFLRAANESTEEVVEMVRRVVDELRMCMFCVGAGTLASLRKTRLYPAGGCFE
ncbi:MAG: alpha-hydroxy-acid oxidizing protein, partial [Acidobacteria bacterium]|nr:alpha-hydroxy-acid oxidizing protein [Acidobacteriota bacterium]